MNTLAAIYKILESVIITKLFLEDYNRLQQLEIAFEIGRIWQPNPIVFSVVTRMSTGEAIFNVLGGYQPLSQIYKLALGIALDYVIGLGIYHTYNTFISNKPTFTSKESGFQDDSSNTTNQTLTDLSPEIVPMGEVLHNDSIDH